MDCPHHANYWLFSCLYLSTIPTWPSRQGRKGQFSHFSTCPVFESFDHWSAGTLNNILCKERKVTSLQNIFIECAYLQTSYVQYLWEIVEVVETYKVCVFIFVRHVGSQLFFWIPSMDLIAKTLSMTSYCRVLKTIKNILYHIFRSEFVLHEFT
jgi:hypothetical protein